MSPALAGRLSTTAPPGKPQDLLFISAVLNVINGPGHFAFLWVPAMVGISLSKTFRSKNYYPLVLEKFLVHLFDNLFPSISLLPFAVTSVFWILELLE